MNRVANYDELDYDYSTYWKKREYEHNAEVLVLNKLLKNEKGRWFLDVGGSFGRVLPTYYDKYSRCVIVDYSLKTLQKNYSTLKKNFPNVELISANAYHLPFRERTFDGALMIRVLHHLDTPKKYFTEIYRVINSKGVYIQEFANKLHIKAVLRALIKFDLSIFNQNPYQQPDRKNNEGARENANVPFLNYHTNWIIKSLKEIGFNTKKKYGCSFLRLGIIKRIFNNKGLILLENIFQNTLSWSNISPSIFIKSIKEDGGALIPKESLEDILICPKCKGDLIIEKEKAVCKKCKGEYIKKENIWDFRI